VTLFLATVLPGLEPIAADEAAAKLPEMRIAETRRGRLLLDHDGAPEVLLALRTIDNLFLFLGTLPAGPHRAHLAALADAAAAAVEPALPAQVRRLSPSRDSAAQRVTLWANASRAGKHSYSRFEAAEAVMHAVLRRHPSWRPGTTTNHLIELRLDVEESIALLSARLTPPSFRFRGEERAFTTAALRPPVAHALVWLSDPHPDDVFLDPFCGSGTILAERAAYPAHALLGGDASAEAVAAARRNLPSDGARVRVEHWDARRLPLDSATVSALVTNLPFGHQVLAPADVAPLYLDFARQAQRVLMRAGVAVVLTDQVDTLLRAVDKTRLRAERVLGLSLKGLHPEVVRLTPP
jgi:tRNA (guanine6-N2)-methyltransferase